MLLYRTAGQLVCAKRPETKKLYNITRAGALELQNQIASLAVPSNTKSVDGCGGTNTYILMYLLIRQLAFKLPMASDFGRLPFLLWFGRDVCAVPIWSVSVPSGELRV